MPVYTHQAYKTYAQAGQDVPVLSTGTALPDTYPYPGSQRGCMAEDIPALEAQGYTALTLAEWSTFNKSFLTHPYFTERAALEQAQAAKNNSEALVDRRVAAGNRARREITALMDLAVVEGGGDPVVAAIKSWAAAGDTDEEQADKYLALLDGAADPYTGFSDLMLKVGQQLSEGSLQLATATLLNGVPSPDLLPEGLRDIFDAAKKIIALESVKFYRKT